MERKNYDDRVSAEARRSMERLLQTCPTCKGSMTLIIRDYRCSGGRESGTGRIERVRCAGCGRSGPGRQSMLAAATAWNNLEWRRRLSGDDLLICRAAREYAEVAADLDKIWRRVQSEKS